MICQNLKNLSIIYIYTEYMLELPPTINELLSDADEFNFECLFQEMNSHLPISGFRPIHDVCIDVSNEWISSVH